MWVAVAERINDLYLGILENQPVSFESNDEFYLTLGAEIPFATNHIADIIKTPEDFISWFLEEPPYRIWPHK